MKKYGFESFSIEEIGEAWSKEDAIAEETRLIAEAGGYTASHVWNLTPGGHGKFDPLPSTKARISKSSRDSWRDPTKREKLIHALTAPDVLNRKNASIKESHSRPEWKAAFSANMKARYANPEYKAKHTESIRKSSIKNLQNPKLLSWRTHKNLSEASKKAIHPATGTYRAVSVLNPYDVRLFRGSKELADAGFFIGNVCGAVRGTYGKWGNIYKKYFWSRIDRVWNGSSWDGVMKE